VEKLEDILTRFGNKIAANERKKVTPQPPLLPDRHPNQDFFVADILDWAAGSDLEHVMKINVLCVSPERFKAFNEIYKRYFPNNPPARIFFCVPVWTGPFDIEIECIAVRKD
jgi:Endoribonuclease L-PSP